MGAAERAVAYVRTHINEKGLFFEDPGLANATRFALPVTYGRMSDTLAPWSRPFAGMKVPAQSYRRGSLRVCMCELCSCVCCWCISVCALVWGVCFREENCIP